MKAYSFRTSRLAVRKKPEYVRILFQRERDRQTDRQTDIELKERESLGGSEVWREMFHILSCPRLSINETTATRMVPISNCANEVAKCPKLSNHYSCIFTLTYVYYIIRVNPASSLLSLLFSFWVDQFLTITVRTVEL